MWLDSAHMDIPWLSPYLKIHILNYNWKVASQKYLDQEMEVLGGIYL